ncbi:MAG: hypothetical protein QOH65_676 [Methylobacteriaceae bacterium]|jgi:hypothetical protein|nr:hypothetical protein [Methylobacteriaceae bacterium]
MQIHSIKHLKHAIGRNRSSLRDGVLLLAFMGIATLIAYEFDIFSNAPGLTPQDHVIELNEALALAALLCVGLLVLSWRLLHSQRREMARRIEAEDRARELAHQVS